MSGHHPDPSAEQLHAIRENTRMVGEAFAELTGEPMPPSRAGVVFLDGFINRQRERIVDDAGALPSMAGCYLGEAMIAELGGRWAVHPAQGLGVEFGPEHYLFPLAKAAKQFANGAEDSVLSMFDVAVALVADRRNRGLVPPGKPV